MPKNNATNNIFLNQPLVQTATNYTALATDVIIEVTSTAAIRTITLPAPSAVPSTSNVGKFYVIKDTSGGAATNNIFVVPVSGTIDGSGSLQIGTNYGAVQVYSDGTNYYSQAFVTPPATGIPLARASWSRFSGSPFTPGATVVATIGNGGATLGPPSSRLDLAGLTAVFAPVNITVAATSPAQTITIVRAGFYQIIFNAGPYISGSGYPVAQIAVNGVLTDTVQTYIASFSNGNTVTRCSNFSVGDVIDIRLVNSTASNSFLYIGLSITQLPTTF